MLLRNLSTNLLTHITCAFLLEVYIGVNSRDIYVCSFFVDNDKSFSKVNVPKKRKEKLLMGDWLTQIVFLSC